MYGSYQPSLDTAVNHDYFAPFRIFNLQTSSTPIPQFHRAGTTYAVSQSSMVNYESRENDDPTSEAVCYSFL